MTVKRISSTVNNNKVKKNNNDVVKQNNKLNRSIKENKNDVVEDKRDIVTKMKDIAEMLLNNAEMFIDDPKEITTQMTQILLELYGSAKSTELTATDSLDQLLLDGFDNEQIWSQIQLFTDPSVQYLSKKCTKLLKDIDDVILLNLDDINDEDEQDEVDEELDMDDIEDDYNEEDMEDMDEEDIEDMEDMDEEDEEMEKKNNNKLSNKRKQLADDGEVDFFSAKAMERFLDDEDEKGEDDNPKFDLGLGDDDLNSDDEDDEEGGLGFPEGEMDEEERRLEALLDKYDENDKKDKSSKKKLNAEDMKFDDFFSNPDDEGEDEFPMDEYNEEGMDDYDDEEDEDEEEEEELKDDGQATATPIELTNFEKKAQKIQERIAQLEKDNLRKKTWTVIGEAGARDRPVNSVLQEDLDFDHTQRVAPVQSQETNTTLEDIIKKRIMDQNFDDVIRKSEEDVQKQYKEKLELDDKKNTDGLASVYEKSFMENSMGVEVDSKLKEEHQHIFKKLNSLLYKLNSLSNFNYTPKRAKIDVSIKQQGKALTMEEKVPVATSTATMVAPEEVYFKKHADQKGDTEMSQGDRKSVRKEFKNKWRHENKEKEIEMRYQEKLNPELAKANQQKRDIENVKKSSNTTVVQPTDNTTGQFKSGKIFSKLQQEQDNKNAGIDTSAKSIAKKKKESSQQQSKKLKL